MTVRRLLAEAAEAIAAMGAGNPRLEAELLLAHALGRARVFLMTHPEHEPAPEARALFEGLLDRRCANEPLQYVLGDAAFRHLTLRVRPGVLIPRAETEVLVDHAWAALQRWRARASARGPDGAGSRAAGLGAAGPGATGLGAGEPGAAGPGAGEPGAARPWVIDVGVGSGAILLALVYEALASTRADVRGAAAPGANRETGALRTDAARWPAGAPAEDRGLWFRPIGIDISAIPLAITAGNAVFNSLPRPHLALGDYLGAIRPDAPVAGIVSNPPYIATGEMPELPAEIREFEPHEALHAGPDGLGAIRILLDQARPFLARGAFLCFEIGGLQADAVRRELADRGLLEPSRIHPDLAGRPRVVMIESDVLAER